MLSIASYTLLAIVPVFVKNVKKTCMIFWCYKDYCPYQYYTERLLLKVLPHTLRKNLSINSQDGVEGKILLARPAGEQGL